MSLVAYRKWIKKNFLMVLVVVICFFSYRFVLPQRPDIARKMNTSSRYVIDGDTLILSDGRRVRLIGVDTPEYHESNKLSRIARKIGVSKSLIIQLGKKAFLFTKNLVGTRPLILKFDKNGSLNGHKDKYGRLLAYVYIADYPHEDNDHLIYEDDPKRGRLLSLNASLLSCGYAKTFTRFSYTEKIHFYRLQKKAREEKRGLWNDSIFQRL